MRSLAAHGLTIPALGFGTWQIMGAACEKAVATALEVGYRHIDTAAAYGNHHEVGRAIATSGIPRGDLFLVSKVWRDDLAYDDVLRSCNQILKELSVNYLDLLLIHWPNKTIPIGETLRALRHLKNSGLIRGIGVSNFTIRHITEALHTEQEIITNQVEFHPSLNQRELKEYCEKNNILITAYSPIAQGKDLTIPAVVEIAQKQTATPAQVILAWALQKGMVAIPKATTRNHITENFQYLSRTLTPDEIVRIDDLNMRNRIIRPSFAEFDD